MLLFMEIDGHIEFRRVESYWPELSATFLPNTLRGEIARDYSITADEQARRLVAKSGWQGKAPLDAKSEAGVAIRAKRSWYCADSETTN
jgi:hypothetical protein